jgi:hyperosmotically inducible protein
MAFVATVTVLGNAQTPAGRTTGNRFTDGWITMKIHSLFVPENALEDSDIDVDTNNGVVTLSGTVATEAGRTRAVAIAKATDGVKSVTDKLRVAPEGAAAKSAGREAGREVGAAAREARRETAGAAKTTARKINDGWITSKIYAQFLTENALDDSDIDVDVTKGVVTLSGTVRSEAGRNRAVAIAKATDGVKNVKDSLKVTARPS